MHENMRRIARNNFPAPASCSDVELRMFWEECVERYEHYEQLVLGGNFDNSETRALELRLHDINDLLNDINIEWDRRPWLVC